MLGKFARKLMRRIERMLQATYYVAIYGRRFPLADWLAARVERWHERHSSGDTPMSQQEWDRQYSAGKWAGLANEDELAQPSVHARYLQELKPNAAILDVGCGEGLLFEHFRANGYSRYLGLDLSSIAADKLAGVHDERTSFICADAAAYEPTERFDAIVFNEILYYLHEPLDVFARYANALNERGILIVSTYLSSWRARGILRQLKSRYRLLGETPVSHGRKSWMCSVFTLKTTQPADAARGPQIDRAA